MFVGNNWEGTADVIDARRFKRLARIDVIPDKEERLAEIRRDLQRQAFFLGIREFVGEGNDQSTDDMSCRTTASSCTSRGRASPTWSASTSGPSASCGASRWRASAPTTWRSPPTAARCWCRTPRQNKVHRLDARTGRKTGEFPSGDSPHENNYSKDGRLVFHASIGRVYTPTDQPLIGPLQLLRDTSKGERYFQVVDANTMQVLTRLDMGQKLQEAGHPEMESAVRPMALSPDERTVYAQISFHHGFIEYDLQQQRVLRVANLPVRRRPRTRRARATCSTPRTTGSP